MFYGIRQMCSTIKQTESEFDQCTSKICAQVIAFSTQAAKFNKRLMKTDKNTIKFKKYTVAFRLRSIHFEHPSTALRVLPLAYCQLTIESSPPLSPFPPLGE
jgi:hypothetical protein